LGLNILNGGFLINKSLDLEYSSYLLRFFIFLKI